MPPPIAILIIGKLSPLLKYLDRDLVDHEFEVVKLADTESPRPETLPDLALLDASVTNFNRRSEIESVIARTREAFPIPLIIFISPELLDRYEALQGIADFVVLPYVFPELHARIKQAVWENQNLKSENVIKRGDLILDLVGYKVYLGGKPVDLTFKEYELLRFLAGNPGKVYSREALLNQVWGYDYYGGDRTVDVHIRRLRSKIEDATHAFIETVWNVGYRFMG
ncbi:MAG: response regulator transcription factor [Chloroflexi bacterium]|nr:response regulator transcription factor [Chloroflexota bacterium]